MPFNPCYSFPGEADFCLNVECWLHHCIEIYAICSEFSNIHKDLIVYKNYVANVCTVMCFLPVLAIVSVFN